MKLTQQQEEFAAHVTTAIKFQQIADLLTIAIDSGVIAYWLDRNPDECWTFTLPEKYSRDACYFAPLLEGGSWTLRTICGEVITLDKAAIVRGLEAMASRSPRSFAKLQLGDDDAETADTFVQYCAFGEVIWAK